MTDPHHERPTFRLFRRHAIKQCEFECWEQRPTGPIIPAPRLKSKACTAVAPETAGRGVTTLRAPFRAVRNATPATRADEPERAGKPSEISRGDHALVRRIPA